LFKFYAINNLALLTFCISCILQLICTLLLFSEISCEDAACNAGCFDEVMRPVLLLTRPTYVIWRTSLPVWCRHLSVATRVTWMCHCLCFFMQCLLCSGKNTLTNFQKQHVLLLQHS